MLFVTNNIFNKALIFMTFAFKAFIRGFNARRISKSATLSSASARTAY